LVRYGVAVAAVVAAVAVRELLDPVLGDAFPFATVFFAVLVAARYGGFGPALMATLLGAVASVWLLLPPRGVFTLEGFENQAGLVLYLGVGLGIAVLGGAMRAAQERWQATATEAGRRRKELRTTLDSIGDAVIVTDAQGRVASLNPVAERLTGWPAGEAVGRPLEAVFAIVNEQTRQAVQSPVARVLREGTVVGLANHTVLVDRGGAERPIDDSAAPIRLGDGRLAGVVLVFRDVTERRDREQVVREQARVLTGILAATVDHLYVVGRDGRYRYVSTGGARVLGLEPHELTGKHWRELGLPADVMERFDAQRERALESRTPAHHSTAFRTPEGEERYFEYTIAPVAGDGPEADAVVVVSRDVTERHRAEAALRQTQALLDAVVNHAPACIFAKDRQGRYLLANRSLARLVGREPRDFPGRTDGDFFPPEVARQFAADDAAIIASGRPRTYEESFPQDGVRRTYLTVKFPLQDERGDAYAACAVATEITDLKRAQQALAESEERFRALMEQAPFSVQIFSPDGRTVGVNRAWEELWGVTPEQVADYNVLADPQLEAKGVLPLVRRAFAGEPVEIPAIEYDPNETIPDRTRHADPRRWVAAVAYPLKDARGRVREVVLVHDDRTARVRAEEALRENEATLRAFYDHSPVCMGVTEPTGDGDVLHLYDNAASCTFFGVAPGATANRRALADLGGDPAVVARWLDRYRESEATGRPVRFEHEYRTPDGPRWLSATVCPIGPGPAGRTRFCYVAEDVTARRHQQEELRQSEERLRLALEAGRMGVWDWDVTTGAVRWSDNLEPIHGLAPGTFGGTMEAFERLIFPDDRPLVREAVARALEGRSSYDIEFRNVWPDGSVHWVAGKGRVFTRDGRPARLIGVDMDVTARKRAEQDASFLADASAALAGLVDYESTLQKVARLAVPTFADWCAVDMLDEGDALRRLAVAHVDPSKVELAHDLHRRYPPDPAAAQGVWNIVRTGRSEGVPEITDELLAATTADAELLRILRALGLRSYMGVPLTARGRVLGVITFIAAESGRRYDPADLTVAEDLAHRAAVAIENARLYQAVRQADRRKDEFLALLGHELRNPLAPIQNALQVLKLPGADAAITRRAREMMERQVEHLVRLVDDLLDVSRIIRGKVELRPEPVEIATVVARAVETSQPVIAAEAHRLEVDVRPEPLWVNGDLVRLAQVVSNLLNNAAKYTDRGGRIRLSAGREGGEAVLRVRDTGIGIAPEWLPRLFDMFFQAERRTKESQGGLGIGLSLVRGLVELHGGTVSADSAGPGRGSEFVVRLPLLVNEGAARLPHRPASPGPVAKLAARRVLVVDDNVDAADSLAMLLRLQGHAVEVAYDGPSALEKAQARPPAVAFLDLGMPKVDGYELARAFRAIPALRDVMLVALTGWGQPEDRQRTREAGFDYHLVKPVDADALHRLFTEPR
jgi:PAS domain S-box-containing protein